MDDGEKYIDTDGRLNVELIRADHTPDRRETFCRRCHEEWPCSIVHAADRIEDFRAGRGRRWRQADGCSAWPGGASAYLNLQS